MRNLARFLLIGCLVAWPVAAQRGGHGGGGFHGGGGGFHGGYGGFHGGGIRGGYGGFRGGYGGYRGYGRYGRGYYGYNRYGWGFGYSPYSWYWPYDDWGWGYPYYDYPYYGYSYPSYGYGYGSSYAYPAYSYGYSNSPVVVYQSNPAPVTVYEPPRPARPETREYDQSSSRSNEKPIYLIAFQNQSNIRAAEAYWVTDGTLHFITLQHEQRRAPLNTVDRALTTRLNRERHVDLRLPESD